MMFAELLRIASGNLARMKLRTALTSAGVMVGIGALVAMLSFAFGIQRNIGAEFRQIGLFRTLQVKPEAAAIDHDALERMASIPGVSLVYPQQSFEAEVTVDTLTRKAVVQGLPARFVHERPFGSIVSGRFFAADSSREAVVTTAWLKSVALPPDSILGRSVRIRAAGTEEILAGLGRRYLDRQGLPPAWSRAIARAAEILAARLRPHPLDLTVVGVVEVAWGFGFRLGELLVPSPLVASVDHLSFSDPMELMALASTPPDSGFAMAVVTVASERDYDRVRREVEEMGFGVVDFHAQFDRMRRDFLVLDAFVVVIGLVALFIASLGIVNTLVMSILERTREIGILKSLGAEDGQIRALFLLESAAIGLIGSLAGILLGYGVSRLASVVARAWMVRKEIPPIDPFHLPLWVAGAGVLFGVLISILAGLYPANRAARIDPVHALRHD